MTMRMWWVAAALALSGCAASKGENAQASAGKSARFSARNELRVAVPDGAKQVRIWFALPQQEAHQTVSNLAIDCSLEHRVVTDDHGNQTLYVEVESPAQQEIVVVESFDIVRREVIDPIQGRRSRALNSAETTKFARELAPNANVPITDEMRQVAAQVAGDATDPVLVARRLYTWTLDNIDYWVKDPDHKKASPVGSSEYCLANKTGNCTDFHSLWAALARARGIPTRIVYGSIFKPELDGLDKDQSYHCWPEFYAPEIGWVSHDVAVADVFHGPITIAANNEALVKLTTASGYTGADPRMVDYYFGNLEERRVVWSVGRDLNLAPLNAAGPVNALPKAYVEVDGKVHPEKTGWVRKLTYHEIKSNS